MKKKGKKVCVACGWWRNTLASRAIVEYYLSLSKLIPWQVFNVIHSVNNKYCDDRFYCFLSVNIWNMHMKRILSAPIPSDDTRSHQFYFNYTQNHLLQFGYVKECLDQITPWHRITPAHIPWRSESIITLR